MTDDSLEKRLENRPENPGDNTERSNSIDDTVKDDKFSWGRFLWDTVKFSPFAFAIYNIVQGTFTPLLTVGGFILGNVYESWRSKEKISYKKMKRDIKTAAFFGASDYWFWTIPNIIPNPTLPLKIARTLFAMPLLGIPYLYVINHALNLRDNYGLKGTLKGIATGKIFGYMREYHGQAVKNVKSQLKQLMWIWPTYFIGFNCLTNIYHRILVSVFNNLVFRVIIGKKAKEAPEKEKEPGLLSKLYDTGKLVKWHFDERFRDMGKYFAPGKHYGMEPA